MLNNITKISPHIYIGPQPDEKLLQKLAKKGIKTVVNLSAKGELGQKLSPEEEGDKLSELKVDYLHLPTSLARLKPSQMIEIFDSCKDLPGPVYIHCRIGQRAVPFGLLMYALRKNLNFERIVERAEKLDVQLSIPSIKMLLKKSIREAHGEEASAFA